MTTSNTTMSLASAQSFIDGIVAMGRYESQMAADYEAKMGAKGNDMWRHRFDDPKVVEAVSVLLANGVVLPLELGYNVPEQNSNDLVFDDGQSVRRYNYEKEFNLFSNDPMDLINFAHEQGVLDKDNLTYDKNQIVYFVGGNPGDMDYCPEQQGLYLCTTKNCMGEDVHYVLSKSGNRKNGHWCVYRIYGSRLYCTAADVINRWH